MSTPLHGWLAILDRIIFVMIILEMKAHASKMTGFRLRWLVVDHAEHMDTYSASGFVGLAPKSNKEQFPGLLQQI